VANHIIANTRKTKQQSAMGKDRSDKTDDKSTPLDPSQEQEQQQQQQQPAAVSQQPLSPVSNDLNYNIINHSNQVPEVTVNNNNNNNTNTGSQYVLNTTGSSISQQHNIVLTEEQQRKAEMMADEDPLLISQSLTYVTDDGGVVHTFQSSPFYFGTYS
jgi:hypothetical protein